MRYIPSAFISILETAFNQLVDARYDNLARVFIGNTSVFINKDDFEELAEFFESDKKFEDIVNIKEDNK